MITSGVSLLVALLLAPLSISLLHYIPSLQLPETRSLTSYRTSTNYIVRFTRHEHAKDYHSNFKAKVRSPGPEAKSCVQVPDRLRVGEIGRLGLVKDVSLELSYGRGLLGESGESIGAFVDEMKRMGKIFTSMSFSEGEGEYHTVISNSSISWRWHLLA